MALLNPWLELLATRPQLLAAHASAWADLLAAEGRAALTGWRSRLVLQIAAAIAVVMGLSLAAVALMLWSVTSAAQLAQPGVVWVLVLVPVLMLALAAGCWVAAQRTSDGGAEARVDRLARQWQADLQLLQRQGAQP